MSAVSPDCETARNKRAVLHDGAAVAVFARDLDAARNAGDAFEPVARDEARVIARAARDDLHVLDAREQRVGIDAEDVRQHAFAGDAAFERVRDRARLLEDFLQHVVLVFAALDGIGGELALPDRPLDRRAVGRIDAKPVRRDLGDVAFFEIREVARFLDQRLHVGAEEVFAFADAGDERRAAPRADDVAGLIAAHDRDRVRAVEALRRADDGTQEVIAFVHRLVHEMRDDFGVGIGVEAVAMRLELIAKLRMVLDDAVVHDRDAIVGHVRMGVDRVRHAVRRPARVRDAGDAGDRRLRVKLLELAHLAGCAHALEACIALEDGNAGRVITSIFERLEACDQDRYDVPPAGGCNDSAHRSYPWAILREHRPDSFASSTGLRRFDVRSTR